VQVSDDSTITITNITIIIIIIISLEGHPNSFFFSLMVFYHCGGAVWTQIRSWAMPPLEVSRNTTKCCLSLKSRRKKGGDSIVMLLLL